MKTVQALKTYFESQPHGRRLGMDELKGLSKEDRHELAALACAEMGEEYDEPGAD
jgi:hypothetical protein